MFINAQCVVEDEVFEMDEFAVDPERGAGIGEFFRSMMPAPTGERAIRSSRRVSAMPASKDGRIRAVMLISEKS